MNREEMNREEKLQSTNRLVIAVTSAQFTITYTSEVGTGQPPMNSVCIERYGGDTLILDGTQFFAAVAELEICKAR